MSITHYDTVIFDMDGLLIDSEPLWEEAGGELLRKYGCKLTHEMYGQTTGLRTREWLEYWFNYFQLSHANIEAAEFEIIEAVIGKVKQKGKSLPGVQYIIEYFRRKQFRIGLATSSPLRLAEIVVELLDIGNQLDTLTSAEFLPFGKPHPQVYINCAAALQADPLRCICFEDSFNGMIAAKAAKMKCIVVPSAAQLQSAKWGAADLKISSLQNFNDLLLARL